ncbi:MAG: NADH-quinone oxidoreductase subunit J family protein [Chitinophagaceae bacterium]
MLSTGTEGYALPFEVVSMLLLAAMIGCIVIALRASPNSSVGRHRLADGDAEGGALQNSDKKNIHTKSEIKN